MVYRFSYFAFFIVFPDETYTVDWQSVHRSKFSATIELLHSAQTVCSKHMQTFIFICQFRILLFRMLFSFERFHFEHCAFLRICFNGASMPNECSSGIRLKNTNRERERERDRELNASGLIQRGTNGEIFFCLKIIARGKRCEPSIIRVFTKKNKKKGNSLAQRHVLGIFMQSQAICMINTLDWLFNQIGNDESDSSNFSFFIPK